MNGKAVGGALFLGCLLLLSFAATTPYSRTADIALISIRLTLVAVLSILVVRERFRHYEGSRGPKAHLMRDGILQGFRRWCYDEQKHSG